MNRAHLDPDWPGPTPALPIILPGETAYFAMSTADGIEDVALGVAANGETVEIIASRPGYGSLIRTYTLARRPAGRTTTLTYTAGIVGIPALFSRSFDDRQKAARTIAEALKLRAELVADSIFSTFDTDFFVEPPPGNGSTPSRMATAGHTALPARAAPARAGTCSAHLPQSAPAVASTSGSRLRRATRRLTSSPPSLTRSPPRWPPV